MGIINPLARAQVLNGLFANHRGIFAVQRVRFRSGAPDSSRVGWCSCIAVRVACCLLCQLCHHLQRVQHQLCHVDGSRTNPHQRGDNLLLNSRHALRICRPIFSTRYLPVMTVRLPAMSASSLPSITHVLRHTFAALFMMSRGNILALQKFSVTTTSK